MKASFREVKMNAGRVELHCPKSLPKATSFLWNKKMALQVNCRGYVSAKFMQPEPAKYSTSPVLEAQTFIQPEQPYFAHHPGRFFYFHDLENNALFSAPYEPVRATPSKFCFSAGASDIRWLLEYEGIRIELQLTLSVDDVVELWCVSITNQSGKPRKLAFYPSFSVGYKSWMNQSASYHAGLGAIIAHSITPYQKVADYYKNKHFKEKTFLLHSELPSAWETSLERFEGEGGLHAPDGIMQDSLSCLDANYQTPIAVLQYPLALAAQESKSFRFIFGAAENEQEIHAIRERYLSSDNMSAAAKNYGEYIQKGLRSFHVQTEDSALNEWLNVWLPRQVYYHGSVNRLVTDAQTRNYLQDAMGMVYIQAAHTKDAILRTLSQQLASGALPDGVLLSEGAELKYINQVPHSDHGIWLPITLKAYLDESNDWDILRQPVNTAEKSHDTVFEAINRVMHYVTSRVDERHLCYIEQGDWCDPMNMVGHLGKGVSIWLTLACAYAAKLWAEICLHHGDCEQSAYYVQQQQKLNKAVNQHAWDGRWYARGITDNGRLFGVSADDEGKIFLNPQSWAMLSDAANNEQKERLMQSVRQLLDGSYGTAMLAPAYTQMQEDIGRVTQKFPGTAENGSIYNHAAAFYIYSLLKEKRSDEAFALIKKMLGNDEPKQVMQRGQLPVFIPNYYRGAYQQYPSDAGKSSHMFNTGTASWILRCFIEEIFGLKGDRVGLNISPKLPSSWTTARANRHFRGATFEVVYHQIAGAKTQVWVNAELIQGTLIRDIESGRHYQVVVHC